MTSSGMPATCDILFSGTGYFTEIMLGDIAAVASSPLRVVVGGRNVDRMKWLVNACRTRSAIYGTQVSFDYVELDSGSVESLKGPLQTLRPKVVVQSASMQSPWKVDQGESEWSNVVAQAGFGVTIAFHALLAFRTATAIKQLNLPCHFVNTCYPDGVNQLLTAAGVPLTTGVGNIGIFSAVVAGRLPFDQRKDVRVFAHHRHIVEWRKPGTRREGPPIRAWVGDRELIEIDDATRDIQLPYRDLNLISAASAVPVLLGLAGEGKRRAHVPGPGGRPGGYPVQVDAKGVSLDLPKGVSEADAIAWNKQFEDKDGVSVEGGRIVYSERARKLLKPYGAEIADGFAAADVEAAVERLSALRVKLGG